MRVLRAAVACFFILIFLTSLAHAQRFDVYFGVGTTQVGAANTSYVDSNTGDLISLPHMGGAFGTFGGEVMIKPSFGIGGQVSLRFAQGDFAGFGLRPIFYDFNGIWTPMMHKIDKKVVPEFQGGFGGVNLRFYDPSFYYYDYNSGRYTNFSGSSNHFQLHAAAGLRFKVKPRVWLRPQVDYHWVRNLNEFGSNNVFSYSLAIGFSSTEY
jgi:hypothetical protein